jgi:hypothetical protein
MRHLLQAWLNCSFNERQELVITDTAKTFFPRYRSSQNCVFEIHVYHYRQTLTLLLRIRKALGSDLGPGDRLS